MELGDELQHRGFPRGPRTQPILPPAELKQAYLACVLEGVTDEAALESCTRDVALTGDLGFAVAAATSPAVCRALDR